VSTVYLPDDHNETLVQNTHPRDWVNPVPTGRYNLVVIGGGTAGLVSAAGAAGLGAKVALIERNLMGGDCLVTGCIPSKAILRSAHAMAELRRAASLGINLNGEPCADFAAVMERMRRIRSEISTHDSAHRFRKLGVDVYFGDARFVTPDSIDVNGQKLLFARAVIATGARAAVPELPGLADSGFYTNESIFNLTELPARFLVIGGGPIGCELAQAFQRLGSQVTLVETGPQVLAREDAQVAKVLEDRLTRNGVEVRLNASVTRVQKLRDLIDVTITTGTQESTCQTNAILVATGRRANVENLNLESAGVLVDKHGISVNDFLQTANPRIYAAGDVCLRFQFTHAADAAARVVIQNALFGIAGKKRASALTIPWCTYTDPEVARIGMNAREARERGVEIETIRINTEDNDRAKTEGESEGFLEVHLKKGSGKILGATIVGRSAGDLLPMIATAMSEDIGLGKLANVILPYPTRAEAIKRAADAYNRTRLTPFIKRVMQFILDWQR